MKVTHVEDHVTHAVISGAQAIDFGISDSPEFFNILSSTLYTDQKLAVIRETLCNAWDAHIEFGCEHLFVDIKLDDKYLIIRDYGPGIAPKMIGPVYGTYGGSTKTSNSQVTGGFGLGCKAPFAYVDDFEVTSYHDGKYTIYRLSKSNIEVGGKPSIVPVVSDIPTQEHGLQVKISVKNPEDRRRFEQLIRRIVQNGAMKMKLNDEELDTLPFDDMQHGFMLTRASVQENFTPVNVRYGNVIYPIQREETYATEWDKIIEFMDRIAYDKARHYGRNDHWSLVLQAAPNTVSVTPSRESLSNQKHTLATILELMQAFLEVKDKELHTECFRLLDDCIEKTWISSSPAVLFETESVIPNLGRRRDEYGRWQDTQFSKEVSDRTNLTSFPQFVQQYAVSAYPEFPGFKRRDRMRRINALIQSGFGGVRGRKILKTYRRAYEQDQHVNLGYKRPKGSYGQGQQVQSSWFHRQIVTPLIRDMDAVGMKADKLFVYPKQQPYYSGREVMWPATKWNPRDIESMWPFARNIVILSFNKMDVRDGDADKAALSKFWLGSTKDALVYVCPRAEAKVQAARDYFISKGVYLIDLTVEQHKQYLDRQEEYIHTPSLKRPKRNGIPVLGKMRDTDGLMYSNLAHEGSDNDIERTTEPKFVYKDGRRNPYNSFEHMSVQETRLLLDMFGADGGFCTNQNQYDRYLKAGAAHWQDYILDKLVEEFTNNARIREFIPFLHQRLGTHRYNSEYYRFNQWLDIIESDKDLYEYFGLVDNRTEDDKKMMQVYDMSQNNYHFRGTKGQNEALAAIVKTLPVSSNLTSLFKKIKDSRLIQMLDCSGLCNVLVHHERNFVTEAQRVKTRDTLLFAIEG